MLFAESETFSFKKDYYFIGVLDEFN